MGLASRIGAYFKSAASVTPGGDIPYSSQGFGASQWPWLMPSTRIDYSVEAGDLSQSSIIMSCIQWICRTFPEAPLRVMTGNSDDADPVDNHPMILKIKRPNPYYNGLLLWQATLASLNLDGNGYWIKFRTEGDLVGELWYEPHTTIRPVIDRSGKEFIAGYQVQRGGMWLDQILPRSDVIHFRNGIDPYNPRMGLSPLKSALREVFTDNEAANFSASVLRNMGVPGIVISPKSPEYTINDPDGLKDAMITKFSGDRKGEPLVMAGPTDIEVLSWSPEQMNLEALRRIPEERITALLGIPAVVAGLGAGLDQSTYNNVMEAKASAYESNILPMQRFLAEQLETDLLPDFGDATTEWCEFDVSDVQALSEDQDALFTRLTAAYQGGWLKRSEARSYANTGLESDPSDDIYVTDLAAIRETLLETENPGTLLPKGVSEATAVALPAPAPLPAQKSLTMEPTTTEGRFGLSQLSTAFAEIMDGLDADTAHNGSTTP